MIIDGVEYIKKSDAREYIERWKKSEDNAGRLEKLIRSVFSNQELIDQFVGKAPHIGSYRMTINDFLHQAEAEKGDLTPYTNRIKDLELENKNYRIQQKILKGEMARKLLRNVDAEAFRRVIEILQGALDAQGSEEEIG